MRVRLIIGAVLLTACLGQAQAKAPAAADGASVACLPLRSIQSTKVIDDRTIDFRVTGRKVYRNTLPNRCPQLGYQQAFSYATSQSQLCSLDIITVFVQGNPGLQGASCGLGRFTPLPAATQ